ncbi:MAG: hypothetical protein HYY25_12595 [Candidatus Wallbacteria bacterium]|nr:hypothetical protein [Candidatus Wallbacteria bacterium]
MPSPTERAPESTGKSELGWMRLVAAFLEEGNIKWLLAVGIALILAASAYFVHINWKFFESYTFLQYALVAGFTAVCSGLASVLTERAGLPSTGRAFHLTAFFLVPLNFLAMALPEIALFSTKSASPEVGWALGLAAYPFLFWVLDRSLVALTGGGCARLAGALIGAAGLLPFGGPASPLAFPLALGAWLISAFGLAEVRHELVLRRRLDDPQPIVLSAVGLIGAFVAHCWLAAPEARWAGPAVFAVALLVLHLSHALREAMAWRMGDRGRDIANTTVVAAHLLMFVATAVAYGGRLVANPAFALTVTLHALVLASTAAVLGSALARRLALGAAAIAAAAAAAVTPELATVLERGAAAVIGNGCRPALLALMLAAYAYALLAGLAHGRGDEECEEWSRDALGFSAAAGTFAAFGALGTARGGAPMLALWSALLCTTWARFRVADLLLGSLLAALGAGVAAAKLAGVEGAGLVFGMGGAAAAFLMLVPSREAGIAWPVMRALASTTKDPCEAAAMLALIAAMLVGLGVDAASPAAAVSLAFLAAVAGWGASARGARLREMTFVLAGVTLLQCRGLASGRLLVWGEWAPGVLVPALIGAAFWGLGRTLGRRRAGPEAQAEGVAESVHPLEFSGVAMSAAAVLFAPFHLPAGVAALAVAAVHFGVCLAAYKLRPLLTLSAGSAGAAIVLAAHGAAGPEGARAALAALALALAAAAFHLRGRLQAALAPVSSWGRRLQISPLMDLALAAAAVLCWLDAGRLVALEGAGLPASALAAAIFIAGAIFYSTDLLTVPALLALALAAVECHLRGWPLALLAAAIVLGRFADLAGQREAAPRATPYVVASHLFAGLATLSALVAPAPLASAATLAAVAAWQFWRSRGAPSHATAALELVLLALARALEATGWGPAWRLLALAGANAAAHFAWPVAGAIPRPVLAGVEVTLANVFLLVPIGLACDAGGRLAGAVMLLGALVGGSCAARLPRSQVAWVALALAVVGAPLVAGDAAVRAGSSVLAVEAFLALWLARALRARQGHESLTGPVDWTARGLAAAGGLLALAEAFRPGIADPLTGAGVAETLRPALTAAACSALARVAGGPLQGLSALFGWGALMLGLAPRCPSALSESIALSTLGVALLSVPAERGQAWRVLGWATSTGLTLYLVAQFGGSQLHGLASRLQPSEAVLALAIQALAFGVETWLRPGAAAWQGFTLAATAATLAAIRATGLPWAWCAAGAAWLALAIASAGRWMGELVRGGRSLDLSRSVGPGSEALAVTRAVSLAMGVLALAGVPQLSGFEAAGLLALAAAHWHFLAPGGRADVAFFGAALLGSLSVVWGAYAAAVRTGATLEQFFLEPYFALTALTMALGWMAAERVLAAREPVFRGEAAATLASAFGGAAFAGSFVALLSAVGTTPHHLARLATLLAVQGIVSPRVHAGAPALARLLGLFTLALWGALGLEAFAVWRTALAPAEDVRVATALQMLLLVAAGYRVASAWPGRSGSDVQSAAARDARAFGHATVLVLTVGCASAAHLWALRPEVPWQAVGLALGECLAGLVLFSSDAGQLVFWAASSALFLEPAARAIGRAHLAVDPVAGVPLAATVLAVQAGLFWVAERALGAAGWASSVLGTRAAGWARALAGWAAGLVSLVAFRGVFEQLAAEASRLSPALVQGGAGPGAVAGTLSLVSLLGWLAALHAIVTLLTESAIWHRSAVVLGCSAAFAGAYQGLLEAGWLTLSSGLLAAAAVSLVLCAAGTGLRSFGLPEDDWNGLSSALSGFGLGSVVLGVTVAFGRDVAWPGPVERALRLHAAALVLALLSYPARWAPAAWPAGLMHAAGALALAGVVPGWQLGGPTLAASCGLSGFLLLWCAAAVDGAAWGFAGVGAGLGAIVVAAWTAAAPQSWFWLVSWPLLSALLLALAAGLRAARLPAHLQMARRAYGEGLQLAALFLAAPALGSALQVGPGVSGRLVTLALLALWARGMRPSEVRAEAELSEASWEPRRSGHLRAWFGLASAALVVAAVVGGAAYWSAGSGPWSAVHLPAAGASLTAMGLGWELARRRYLAALGGAKCGGGVWPGAVPEEWLLQEAPALCSHAGLALALACFAWPQPSAMSALIFATLALSAAGSLGRAVANADTGAAMIGCGTAYAAALRVASVAGWQSPAAVCLLLAGTSMGLLGAGARCGGFGLRQKDWKTLSSQLDVLGLLSTVAGVLGLFLRDVAWPSPESEGFALLAAAVTLAGMAEAVRRWATPGGERPDADGGPRAALLWPARLFHIAAAVALAGVWPAARSGGWYATGALALAAVLGLLAGLRQQATVWGLSGSVFALAALPHAAWTAAQPRSAELLLAWPVLAGAAFALAWFLERRRAPAWLEGARAFHVATLLPAAALLGLPSVLSALVVGFDSAFKLALLGALFALARTRRANATLGLSAAALAVAGATTLAARLAAGAGGWSPAHLPAAALALVAAGVIFDRLSGHARACEAAPELLERAVPQAAVSAAMLAGLASVLRPLGVVHGLAVILALGACSRFWLFAASGRAVHGAAYLGCGAAFAAVFRLAASLGWLSPAPLLLLAAATSAALLRAGRRSGDFGLSQTEWKALSDVLDLIGLAGLTAGVAASSARHVPWPSDQSHSFALLAAALVLQGGAPFLESVASGWSSKVAHLAAGLGVLGVFPAASEGGWSASLALAAGTAVVLGGAARTSGTVWGFAGLGLTLACLFDLTWQFAAPRAWELLFSWPLAAAVSLTLSWALARARVPEYMQPACRFYEGALRALACLAALPALTALGRVELGSSARLLSLTAVAAAYRALTASSDAGRAAALCGVTAVAVAAAGAGAGFGDWSLAHLPCVAAVLVTVGFIWDLLLRRPAAASRLPEELREPGMSTTFVTAALILALVAFVLPATPVTVCCVTAVLAGTGLFALRSAYDSGNELAVYVGEACLAGVYVYLRTSGILHGSPWAGLLGVMLDFGLLAVSQAAAGWRRPVFARPLARTALTLPFLLMAAFLHRGPTTENILMVLVSGAFYSSASLDPRHYGLRFLAAALYNVGLGMVWMRLEFVSWQAYVSPVGMTLLWATELERDAFSPRMRNRLRLLASLLVLGAPALEFASRQSVANMLNLAAICVAAIFGGIWMRVRVFLYFGAVLLAGDLLGFAVSRSIEAELSAVWMLLSAGGLVITIAAFFEKKRAELAEKLGRWKVALESWD